MIELISVVVTTYNRPDALSACLNSLLDQDDQGFEILIADDGSTDETHKLIDHYKQQNKIAVRHVYHKDDGFRAATIRNKAVAESRGQYLLFVDGDCIALKSFIARHRTLAEEGFFVPGNRCLLSPDFTRYVLNGNAPLHQRSLCFFLVQRLCGHINRWLPLVHIPLQRWRYWQPKRWQNAMTCNLAAWKTDFLNANGFDEQFQGWGYEDSDLVIRLIHSGIKRKEGRFAVPVLHLWHPQNDRSRHDENYQRLMDRLADPTFTRAEKGIDQYL